MPHTPVLFIGQSIVYSEIQGVEKAKGIWNAQWLPFMSYSTMSTVNEDGSVSELWLGL